MPKKSANQNLFKKLTRLFKSGPVVRRKVRAMDTLVATPDKTKSSAVALFQKSMSPSYSAITANAYNMSERLMRYQDFQEMEACIDAETLIAVPDGFKTIGELAKECVADPSKTFIVYAYDHHKKQLVPALAKQARHTVTAEAFKVTFDNGKSITTSWGHRLMLRDGTFREAQDLKPGDSMMPFHRKDLFENAKNGTKGYRWIYTMDPAHRGWTKEHQLIAEWIAGRELAPDECVHHINFVKTDNRPENLRIMTKSDHDSYHTGLNNEVKWSAENAEWIERFKDGHASWMRDNAPTQRRDVTFGRILETAERVGFNAAKICQALDASLALVHTRLLVHGFKNFETFAAAYRSDPERVANSIADQTQLRRTKDLSLDEIRRTLVDEDTAATLAIKLGCTTNVLSKFFERRTNTSLRQLRQDLGFKQLRNCATGRGKHIVPLTFQQVCDAYVPGMSLPRLAEKLSVNKNTILSRISQNGFKKYSEFQSSYKNCKVVSVEPAGVMPLYDLTVDGYKNFATDSVISHNTPELAAALDIYADETVASDERGRSLHVYSDDPKIKSLLEDLFYSTLNVEFNLRPWTRNLAKYGDFFAYCDVSPQHGVLNLIPIPVNEIEREEGFDRADPLAVRFRWHTLGNRVLENWEVMHMRLMSNDLFLPYGSSIIEPARRIWRQLILIEDAMLVYRITRAPERRVFYVDIGNIAPENVAQYMEQARAQLRTQQVVDNSSGRQDMRYNPMSIDQDYFIAVRGNETGTKIDTLAGGQNAAAIEDVAYIQRKLFAALKIPKAYLGYDEALSCLVMTTRIPLLDGRTLSVEEIAAERKLGIQHWVYSYDKVSGKIVPGEVINAGPTRPNAELVRVTLDNGESLDCTPDHKWMLRDGTWCEAGKLTPGTSLMPLYRKLSSKKEGDLIDGYDMVWQGDDWEYTHKVVNETLCGDNHTVQKQRVIHHKDCDKLNNDPSNLEEMTWHEHRKWHAEHLETTLLRPDVIAKREPVRIAALKAPRHRALKSVQMTAQHADPNSKLSQYVHSERISEASSASMIKNWEDPEYRAFKTAQNKEIFTRPDVREKITGDNHWSRRANAEHDIAWLKEFAQQNDVTTANQWNVDHPRSVYSISPVGRPYVCSLLKRNGYKNWSEFAKRELGINPRIRSADKKICHNHKVVSVEVLPNREQTGCISVRGYENFATVANVLISNSKSTLAQEDIRFSRTISTIQRVIVSELNKLAIIHLFAHGYEGEDLLNFVLRLSNPSTVAQQQKLELYRAKFEIAATVPEGLLDRDYIRKNVLGLNNEEISDIEKGKLADMLSDQKLQADAEAATSGGGGGGRGNLFAGGEAGGEGGEAPAAGGGGGEEAEGAPPEAEPAAAAGGGEEEEEENASEEPPEEEDPELELLTSGDDPADDSADGTPVKLTMRDLESPVKAQNQIDRMLHNRSRRRTHGASKTHMPDFVKMTSSHDSFDDPHDMAHLRAVVSNPLEEAELPRVRPVLSPDVADALAKMGTRFGWARRDSAPSSNLLAEDATPAPVDEDAEPVTDELLLEAVELLDDDEDPTG